MTEKAPLMSTDELYAGAPGRRAPVCVTRHLFRITTKTSGQAMFQTLLLHTLHPWR